MRRFIYYIIFLLIPCGIIFGQGFTDQQLRDLEDEELLSLFNEVGTDSIKQERIARVYLNRARKQKDTIKMARGYDRLARIFHPEKNIQFADSVIELTKNMEHITYPALGYILKGYEYFVLDDLRLSTENFITAYDIALKNNNINQEVYISDRLIMSMAVWGNKEKALELQIKRNKIITSDNFINDLRKATRKDLLSNVNQIFLKEEIISTQNFTFCYLSLKKLDSARFYLNKGLLKVESYDGFEKAYIKDWFIQCSIEIDYYNQKYTNAINTIDKELGKIISIDSKNVDNEKLMDLYYFKGLSLIEIGNYNEGINYLKKSDSVFDNAKVLIQPYDRVLFEKLLDYYGHKGSIDKQLEYLNKLLYADSIFKENYLFFEPNLIRNFETPRLLAEKEALISSLTQKNQSSSLFGWTSAVLFLLSLSGLLYYFKRQNVYKRRFARLMEQGLTKTNDSENNTQKNKISSEVINTILEQLDDFESSNQFISQEISLNELAKAFGTNSRYLSRIINLEKEKNFSHYINDLRLEFAFQKLSEDNIFRRYTIKAIANDCGFNRAEVFSKAFYRKYKIYPSFYIKQLEEHAKKR